jgi:phage baseplate assembly protein gpV
MKKLLNVMRLQAMLSQSGQTSTKLGLVTAYNPADHTVKVTLQPEGVETGWIPLGALWVGPGWGMFAAPTLQTLVQVEFQEGCPEAGVAVLRLFNDQARPLAVQAGEFWLVHKLGASFKLTNDGAATFADGHGAQVMLDGAGNIQSQALTWQHAGPFQVLGLLSAAGLAVAPVAGVAGSGTASVQGTLSITGGDVVADGIGLKPHHHTVGGTSTSAAIA